MNISIVNDSGIKANCRQIKKVTLLFLGKASRVGKCQWDDISLVLTNNSRIQIVNRDFLKHDNPTDVISFNYQPMPGEANPVSGELFVNVELAVRLGKRFKTPEQELALYIAHGCDHLAGADDATPQQRRRMRARELRWVKDAHQRGLLEGLLT